MTDRLAAADLEHDLADAFEKRVVVSRDGAQVFCYADTREQAQRAQRLIGALASRHGWTLETQLSRWHPSAQEWEDPEQPLPETGAQAAAERGERMAKERRETEQRGYPAYEVRLECPSHEAAVQMADELSEQGVESVRRSRYLLVGAADEDTARVLAQRLQERAPTGCTVTIEGTGREAIRSGPSNPFALFGGVAL